jgi:hypothetical protein
VEHVLGTEPFTDLLTEKTPVNRRVRMHVNKNCYAVRDLERKVLLHPDVLQHPNAVDALKWDSVLKI